MRVIGGEAKGMKLAGSPNAKITRPLADRAKEALFNILAPSVVNSRFLDLFAGTGAVGIEALSRGAAHTTFVESNQQVLAVLQKNLTNSKFGTCAKVVANDVFYFVPTCRELYDIVFAGPPQYKGLYQKTLRALDRPGGPLSEEGIAIIQCHSSEYQVIDLEYLCVSDTRKYGNVFLAFFQRK